MNADERLRGALLALEEIDKNHVDDLRGALRALVEKGASKRDLLVVVTGILEVRDATGGDDDLPR